MRERVPSTEDLFKSLRSRLKRFILTRVWDAAAADDIVQEVFLKIHSSIGTLRDQTKVETWIFQIARNAIVDYFRRLRPVEEPSDESFPSEVPSEQDDMDEIFSGLRGLIKRLPALYREAIMMTEYGGLTQMEYAKRAGISISAAKSRVQRARAMLKDWLMTCCHFEFDKYGTIIDYRTTACCCCSQGEDKG
jgi:RNA polymerase sigma-70 factor (ECF subfamily)